jgi:DNA-binding protein Fis
MSPTPDWERFVRDRIRSGSQDLYQESLRLMDRYLIRLTLRVTGGDHLRAASALGLTPEEFRAKLRDSSPSGP